MDKNKCSKCGGEMEEGLYASILGAQLFWAKGRNLIGGLKQAVKTQAFRCKSCGFLESYAVY